MRKRSREVLEAESVGSGVLTVQVLSLQQLNINAALVTIQHVGS